MPTQGQKNCNDAWVAWEAERQKAKQQLVFPGMEKLVRTEANQQKAKRQSPPNGGSVPTAPRVVAIGAGGAALCWFIAASTGGGMVTAMMTIFAKFLSGVMYIMWAILSRVMAILAVVLGDPMATWMASRDSLAAWEALHKGEQITGTYIVGAVVGGVLANRIGATIGGLAWECWISRVSKKRD